MRLTALEHAALFAGWVALETNAEGEDDPARWREVRAFERAMRKINKTIAP